MKVRFIAPVLLSSLLCHAGCRMKNERELVPYEKLGNYAQYSVISNSSIIVRTFGYADSIHSIVKFEVKRDESGNAYSITYYVNSSFKEEEASPEIQYLTNGTVEVRISVLNINENTKFYYEDAFGKYEIGLGNDSSWNDYLEKIKKFDYGEPSSIGIK